MPLLQLTGVSKNFGGLEVLRDVSFGVDEGEIVGLIGANGAGKTTLFNVISGLLSPSSGSITFLGQEIGGLRPYRICRLGIARTFQIVRPFAGATVAQNLHVAAVYGRHGQGPPDADLAGVVSRLLGTVGLAAKADVVASSLTLVELKQLELARALATNPRLLLLDETFSGLTPTETQRAMALVTRIHRELGMTILWIEHVMRAIMRVAQRLVVLDHGVRIAEGTPAVIARNPDVIEAYLGRPRMVRK